MSLLCYTTHIVVTIVSCRPTTRKQCDCVVQESELLTGLHIYTCRCDSHDKCLCHGIYLFVLAVHMQFQKDMAFLDASLT